MTSLLDTRLSNFREKTTAEQVDLALSVILDSPNGEAPILFSMLEGTPAAEDLAAKVTIDTGLMTEAYFKEQVKSRIVTSRIQFEKEHKLIPLLYTLMLPKDVMVSKAYLKTNEIASTKILGSVDGVVGALFEGNHLKVKEALKEGKISAYSSVPCSTYSRLEPNFDKMHKHAVYMLLPKIRAEICKDPSLPTKFYDAYIGLKQKYNIQ